MIFSHIVAADLDGNIGYQNEMPWKIKSDFQWFKKHTLGKICIVGNNTMRSIGRVLPHRRMIVLTRTHVTDFGTLPHFRDPSVMYVNSMDEAIAVANKIAHPLDNEVMIIGGQQIYRDSAPYIDRVYYTEVDTTIIDADAYYPVDTSGANTESSRVNHSGESDVNDHACSYYIFNMKDMK